MADCTVVVPTTLAETLAVLAQAGEDAVPVAGGVWVTLTLRSGLVRPRVLLSLRRLAELGDVALEHDGSLRLGALLTHRAVERSPLVRAHWPVLAETLADVANVRVREQATLVGNLCEADPASDPPAVLAALGATVELASWRGQRVMPVAEFIRGAYETARDPDELVTSIRIPPLPAGAGTAYCKFRTRSHEDRPAVGVAAVVALDSAGRVTHLEVVVGAAGDRPQRVPEALAAVPGAEFDDELVTALADAYAGAVETVSDLRASAWYRREMVRVFVARALRLAAHRAGWCVGEGPRV
ncbi:xanthine dehydrogenase family protein subunit M [Thermomicrobium sp. 4228-Ro]|uniref:FAD binding domain-containing protein n=1 Tax=Thermomicrobium sp. 4228-Ro TaxID=2993937 RepID=UPI002248A702|nr:xanthine dehydrogenase family protein subunit M [Thermomicrobium sp. 4228-Ro]MCX2727982.1 xanthine dehydrogenase family protein subunit M [Thermomicrobium sp. 4228-Ro]